LREITDVPKIATARAEGGKETEMGKQATIYSGDCEETAERVTLPEPFYEAEARGQEDYTGKWVTGLYYGPRSGRCFVETYSIWDDGKGRCTGEVIREVSLTELLTVADHVGAALPEGIPAPVVE
jgi:hypothetical protein